MVRSIITLPGERSFNEKRQGCMGIRPQPLGYFWLPTEGSDPQKEGNRRKIPRLRML